MTSRLLRAFCIATLALPATASEGQFEDMSIYDALAAARRAKRFVLVSWVREGDPQCKRMNQVLADAEVATWIKENTLAIQVDGGAEPAQARNWGIQSFPSTVILRPNGNAILTVEGYKSAPDFLQAAEAARTAARAGDDGTLEEPTGEAALDPEAWLQYAHGLFGRGDEAAADCLGAYLWCLDNGEAHSPGFLDRNLDLILERAIALDRIAGSRVQLRERRDLYERALVQGFGTPATLRAIIAISEHLKEPRAITRALDTVTSHPEPDPVMVRIAADGSLPILVGHRRYDRALEHAGDVVERARTEASLIRRDGDGQTPGIKISTAMDSRRAYLLRNGYYYEALLGEGRGADAQELAGVVMDAIPTGNACAELIDHARRLELPVVAEKLAEMGRERVQSEKGLKVIQRALTAPRTRMKALSQEDLQARREREALEQAQNPRERPVPGKGMQKRKKD